MGQLGTPCENGGNCTDAFNDYVCDCVTGWIGDECQADVNECAVADPIGDFNPCENGGICLDQIGSYECDCFNTGYEGDLCDVDIDECLLFPCQNGGKPFFQFRNKQKNIQTFPSSHLDLLESNPKSLYISPETSINSHGTTKNIQTFSDLDRSPS